MSTTLRLSDVSNTACVFTCQMCVHNTVSFLICQMHVNNSVCFLSVRCMPKHCLFWSVKYMSLTLCLFYLSDYVHNTASFWSVRCTSVMLVLICCFLDDIIRNFKNLEHASFFFPSCNPWTYIADFHFPFCLLSSDRAHFNRCLQILGFFADKGLYPPTFFPPLSLIRVLTFLSLCHTCECSQPCSHFLSASFQLSVCFHLSDTCPWHHLWWMWTILNRCNLHGSLGVSGWS